MAKHRTRARTARKRQPDGTIEGKNPNGAGSVFERRDGRWSAQLVTVDEVGKKWRRTFYARSERDVRAKLREAQTGIDKSAPQPARYGAAARRVTVAEYVKKWLDLIADDGDNPRSPGTMRKYRQLFRDYIEPQMGARLLSEVSTEQVQDFYSRLKDRLSHASIEVVHAILHGAFDHAAGVHPPVIPYSPVITKRLSRGGRAAREAKYLTSEDAAKLLKAAALPQFARWRAAVTLAVMTGLRRGELLALCWGSEGVDMNARTILVGGSLKPIEGGGMEVGSTKSKAGRRLIVFEDIEAEALAAHWKLQLAEREHAGELWEDGGYVFANEFGRYSSPSTFRRRWDDIVKAAGLEPIDIKSARHGQATLMDAANVDLKVRANRMGHSNERMTMSVYTHADIERQRAAAKALNEQMKAQLA